MSNTTLSIDDVIVAVRKHVSDDEKVKAIIKDLAAVQQEVEEDKPEKGPKAKNKFVVLIRGDAALKDKVAGGAWVVSCSDDETLVETYSGEGLWNRILKAVRYHNDNPGKVKKRHKVIKTFFGAMNTLKPKTFKLTESVLSVKTREPVEVIVVEKDEIV